MMIFRVLTQCRIFVQAFRRNVFLICMVYETQKTITYQVPTVKTETYVVVVVKIHYKILLRCKNENLYLKGILGHLP